MATAPEIAYGVPLVSVVGEGFCVPYSADIFIKNKCSKLDVLDSHGKPLPQVHSSVADSLRRCCRNSNPHNHRKQVFPRRQWMIERGESSELSDVLFQVQPSHCLHLKPGFHVFLPYNNISPFIPDFQIVHSHTTRSCRVYKGDTLIAEVTREFIRGRCRARKSCRVQVFPGLDYAFIVALIVILFQNIHCFL